MPYITQADITTQRMPIQRLTQLTNDDKAATQPDPTVVASVCAAASARVDMYCGQRYALPLQPSLMVVELALDIAVYEFYKRRNQNRDGDSVSLAYNQAITTLQQVAKGTASLDQPDAPLDTQLSSGDVLVTEKPQVFDRRGCEGWIGDDWV